MKVINIYLLGLLFIFYFTSCQTTQNNVQLVGTLEGAESSKLYIGKVGDYFMNTRIVDSIECKDNTFSHVLNISKSDSLYCIEANGQLVYFLPDNDMIEINGSINSLFESSVTGSENNSLLTEYWKSARTIYDMATPLNIAMNKAQQEQNIVLLDSIKKQLEPIYSKIQALPEEFVSSNTDSKAAAVILFFNLGYYTTNLKKLETLYETLDKEVKNSPVGVNVNSFISSLETIGIGKPYIDFELTNQQNRRINISSLHGKYFLIDFWTTWCGPCIGELPFLKKAFETYSTKGFDIISISLDDSKENWNNAVDKMETPWLQTIVKNSEKFNNRFEPFESDVAKAYAVLGVPTNYLVNPEGIIIASNLRGEVLAEKLSELYNN